jgi:hypothetical protein
MDPRHQRQQMAGQACGLLLYSSTVTMVHKQFATTLLMQKEK